MHDFVFDESLKPMQDLYKIFNGLLFRYVFLFFQVGAEITLVAKFKDEINVIDSLFDID